MHGLVKIMFINSIGKQDFHIVSPERVKQRIKTLTICGSTNITTEEI